MKKNRIKLFICALALIVSNCLSFASIISNSDGSAFITKEEFESLKNELDSQIDRYNYSLDNKIDGAIAAYIAALVKNNVKVQSNVFALEWPLTIINKLKVIEEVTTKDTNRADQEPLWNLSYTMFGAGGRGSYWAKNQTSLGSLPERRETVNIQLDKLENTHIDKIENYLNGARVGANDFKVQNLCNKPELRIRTGFIVENLQNWYITSNPAGDQAASTNKGVYSDIVFDLNSIVNRTYVASSSPSARINLLTNYQALWQTTNFSWGANSPYINLVHYANDGNSSLGSSAYATTQEKYSYYTNPTMTVWEGVSGINRFNAGTLWSSEYKYSNSNLDRIYNYGDNTRTTHFAPVTYNNNLYFTNKRANRIYVRSAGRVNWEARDNKPGNPFGIYGVLSAGENLENETENSSGSRPWYNKSLISQSRLVYDFKDDAGNEYLNHRMVNGIPIFVTPKTDILDMEVEINIESQKAGYASNPKYVIFSEKPITTQNYSANVESNTDYIVVKNSKPTANLRKARLSEGLNKLELGDFYKNTVIYMKILWNDADEEYITLQKPSISYRPE